MEAQVEWMVEVVKATAAVEVDAVVKAVAQEMEKDKSRVHLESGVVERASAVAVGSRLVPKADHAVVATAPDSRVAGSAALETSAAAAASLDHRMVAEMGVAMVAMRVVAVLKATAAAAAAELEVAEVAVDRDAWTLRRREQPQVPTLRPYVDCIRILSLWQRIRVLLSHLRLTRRTCRWCFLWLSGNRRSCAVARSSDCSTLRSDIQACSGVWYKTCLVVHHQ